MFDFDDDGDFDLVDLVEADIEYGLFEDDDNVTSKKNKKSYPKTFWDIFKNN